MAKRKSTKEETTIYKTLHRILGFEQNEFHNKPVINTGAPEGWVVPAPIVTPVMLLQSQTM